MPLHHLHAAQHQPFRRADPRRQGVTLRVGGLADAVVDQLFGHRDGQRLAVAAADPFQHHVHRRRAARTGEQPRVALVQLGGNGDVGIGLGEFQRGLPMQRDGFAPQNPRLGQNKHPGVDGAHRRPLAPHPPHQTQQIAVAGLHRVEPRADDQRIAALVHGARGEDLHAVGGQRVIAFRGMQGPPVQLLGRQAIGHAQGLHRRKKRHRRKARHQQKGEGVHRREIIKGCRILQ